MSRSGYSDGGEDNWALVRWRGAVASAIRGKRGQALLAEMAAALDAIPAKRLIAHEIRNESEEVCALGAVAMTRAMPVDNLDPEDIDTVATAFGVPRALACEITFMNDEWNYRETPEQRWVRMREWVRSRIEEPGR